RAAARSGHHRVSYSDQLRRCPHGGSLPDISDITESCSHPCNRNHWANAGQAWRNSSRTHYMACARKYRRSSYGPCTRNSRFQWISNVRKTRRGGVRSAKEHSTGGDTRITPCDQPIRARQVDLLSHTRVLWSSTVSVCRFRCSGATHRQQWREVDYGRHDYFCV